MTHLLQFFYSNEKLQVETNPFIEKICYELNGGENNDKKAVLEENRHSSNFKLSRPLSFLSLLETIFFYLFITDVLGSSFTNPCGRSHKKGSMALVVSF